MNIFEGLKKYRNQKILDRLLPYGIDRTTAIVLLSELNTDISIFGIGLEEEEIYETGYFAVLDRLPFRVCDLTDEDRELLDAYCTYNVLKDRNYGH